MGAEQEYGPALRKRIKPLNTGVGDLLISIGSLLNTYGPPAAVVAMQKLKVVQ